MGIRAPCDHGVGEIAAAIGDIDQRLSTTGRRRSRFRYHKVVEGTRRRDHDRTHGALFIIAD
jgi:hypothetical protein